jgi:hypothetical protein
MLCLLLLGEERKEKKRKAAFFSPRAGARHALLAGARWNFLGC